MTLAGVLAEGVAVGRRQHKRNERDECSHSSPSGVQGSRRQSLFKSWAISVSGFMYAVRNERNVALVCVCMVIAVVLAIALRISLIEWVIVVLCCGLVLTSELLNTAIEAVTDLACNEEIHPLAKIAKDVAAGATLVTSVTSLIIALLVFGPRILALIN